MRNKLSIIQLTTRYLFFAVIVSGFVQSAMASCVQSYSSSDTLQSATIIGVDGNNGCVDIQGQYGCTIKNPAIGSSCNYDDGTNHFTATVTAQDSLGMRWEVTNNNINIDTFQLKGASKGINNCLTSFTYDEISGSGGDCTSFDADNNCLSYSGVGSIDFCSDLVEETPPPPPVVAEKLSFCQAPNSDPNVLGTLDDTGIKCPVYTESDPPPPGSDAVIGQQKPVVVCNLEKDKADWGATDGSDVCCQCGIPEEQQTECVVTEDRTQCAQSMTVNPTQSVEIIFFKDNEDPCTWIKTAQGWKQWCY